LPSLTSPKPCHLRHLTGHRFIRVFSKGVTIDVHDHEVHEDFNRSSLPRRLDHFPCQIDVVWVQQAQRPPIVLELRSGENALEEHVAAVLAVSEHVLSVARVSTQELRSFWFSVDEMILVKRGIRV